MIQSAVARGKTPAEASAMVDTFLAKRTGKDPARMEPKSAAPSAKKTPAPPKPSAAITRQVAKSPTGPAKVHGPQEAPPAPTTVPPPSPKMLDRVYREAAAEDAEPSSMLASNDPKRETEIRASTERAVARAEGVRPPGMYSSTAPTAASPVRSPSQQFVADALAPVMGVADRAADIVRRHGVGPQGVARAVSAYMEDDGSAVAAPPSVAPPTVAKMYGPPVTPAPKALTRPAMGPPAPPKASAPDVAAKRKALAEARPDLAAMVENLSDEAVARQYEKQIAQVR